MLQLLFRNKFTIIAFSDCDITALVHSCASDMGTTSSKAKKRDSGAVAPYSDPSPKKVPPETISDTPEECTSHTPQPLPPVVKSEPSSAGGWAVNTDFNHDYTEGQCRRDIVTTCEAECSEITDFLFVGAAKVTWCSY